MPDVNYFLTHRRQLLVNLSSRVKPRQGLCYRSVSTTFSEGPRCGCHKRTGEDSDERASKGGAVGGGERQGRHDPADGRQVPPSRSTSVGAVEASGLAHAGGPI